MLAYVPLSTSRLRHVSQQGTWNLTSTSIQSFCITNKYSFSLLGEFSQSHRAVTETIDINAHVHCEKEARAIDKAYSKTATRLQTLTEN